MLLEVDQYNSVLRKYTWGLDLSRDREGAGGIGGLLSVEDATIQGGPGEYVYFYDANGNVGQLVDWADIADWQQKGLTGPTDWHADRLVAHYEYDPYGNNLLDPTDAEQSGPYAATTAIRFSTRPFDDETGLGSWPARYYSPRFGRWLNRDPIEERGGIHLYQLVRNAPADGVDPHGSDSDWRQYVDEYNRRNNPPARPSCKDSLTFKGHGIFISGDPNKKQIR
ncbi:MAG: RHS repeat-associated core domain-containing protein [Planctomycetes bacterium]|nr:RHS repeat-associated core domain-containing protein [Planctomycetota bacterium]